MDTSRALEIVLSRCKMDKATSDVLRRLLAYEREADERRRRAEYRAEQEFFNQG